MKNLRFLFLTLCFLFFARPAQAIVLQWYIDNEEGSPDYDYAQMVVVSADQSITLYSYRIEMDAAGQHELIDPEMGTWSSMNLEEYLTFYEDGETDPAIGFEPSRGYVDHGNPKADMVTMNFTGYTFYFRMLDAEGNPVQHLDGTMAESEHRVFPQDLEDFYFDDGSISPTPWIININPVMIPEPATGLLALVGVGLLLPRRRKDSKVSSVEVHA